ncbi:MAG: TonB-dependent receptor, partial [Pseudomonadota bacterium]|nr:TonB-dependent receptor [Pseudomonadota bacterium]
SATEQAGDMGYAKHQYQWSASYAGKHWNYGLSANYNSATVLDVQATNLADQRDFWKRESFTMWDGFVGYRFNEQVRINLAVQNLRNQIGPFPYVDDALGRRFMLTTQFRF